MGLFQFILAERDVEFMKLLGGRGKFGDPWYIDTNSLTN
jgi:hypothetical protein